MMNNVPGDILLAICIIALVGLVGLVVIVWRGGAVDKAKADAALLQAETGAAAQIKSAWAWLRAKFSKAKE